MIIAISRLEIPLSLSASIPSCTHSRAASSTSAAVRFCGAKPLRSSSSFSAAVFLRRFFAFVILIDAGSSGVSVVCSGCGCSADSDCSACSDEVTWAVSVVSFSCRCSSCFGEAALVVSVVSSGCRCSSCFGEAASVAFPVIRSNTFWLSGSTGSSSFGSSSSSSRSLRIESRRSRPLRVSPYPVFRERCSG